MPSEPQVPPPQCWSEAPGGIILAVKAQPGAKRTAIGTIIAAAAAPGWPDARLKIAISDPPEGGRANASIIAALAAYFALKPAAITLQTGATARDKKFLITGSPADLIGKLL